MIGYFCNFFFKNYKNIFRWVMKHRSLIIVVYFVPYKPKPNRGTDHEKIFQNKIHSFYARRKK